MEQELALEKILVSLIFVVIKDSGIIIHPTKINLISSSVLILSFYKAILICFGDFMGLVWSCIDKKNHIWAFIYWRRFLRKWRTILWLHRMLMATFNKFLMKTTFTKCMEPSIIFNAMDVILWHKTNFNPQ